MNKIKIIALFGKSGAGKDTIQKWMVSNLNYTKGIINYTTRPKRDYEINHIDYHFISEEEFAKKVLNGTMLEATFFKNWAYGTCINELEENKINIGVFSINAIECLLDDNRLDILPIFINAPDKIRLQRNLSREKSPDCEEICRRFLSDNKDFQDIRFDYITFLNNRKNPDFYNIQNLPEVVSFIKDIKN